MDVEPSMLDLYEDEEIIEIIKKHPYFKNPCKYPIRIISIMKYLKRKGLDVHAEDADLKVDALLSSLGNVNRIAFGLYKITK